MFHDPRSKLSICYPLCWSAGTYPKRKTVSFMLPITQANQGLSRVVLRLKQLIPSSKLT